MSRKPTHKLRILNKITNEKGTIGVGWSNEDQSISIVLLSHVNISQNKDEVITLFLETDKSE